MTGLLACDHLFLSFFFNFLFFSFLSSLTSSLTPQASKKEELYGKREILKAHSSKQLVDRSAGGEEGLGPWYDAMVPARNLLRRHCDSYGSYLSGGDSHFHGIDGLSSLKPKYSMADEPPPAPEDEQHGRDSTGLDDDTSGSGGWLQLGLATPPVAASDRPERMTPLELFSGRPSSPSSSVSPASATYPAAAWPGIGGFRAPMMGMTMTMVPWMGHRREMPWGRWNPNLAMGGSPTMMLPPVMPEFVARQFMYPISSSASPSVPEVGPEVRVVSPPRRPQSGVWILLQVTRNQGREPFLPQIPKSYLRIKDGRMTVRLLMKYLMNKLGLEDESEVEITCRGQPLLPFLTLQHVRDNIWRSRETTTLLQDLPGATDHVMMLRYSRSTCAKPHADHV